MNRKLYSGNKIKKDTMLPALIGMITGGFIGSLQGTVTATIFFSFLGTMIGILTAHACAIPVDKPKKNTINTERMESEPKPDPDEEEYLLIDSKDIPSTLETTPAQSSKYIKAENSPSPPSQQSEALGFKKI